MTRSAIPDFPSDSDGQNQTLDDLPGGSHQIKGNASEKVKDLASAIFFHFIDAKGNSYGSNVGRKLKFAELNIFGFESASPGLSHHDNVELVGKRGVGNDLSVETIFEVVVDRGVLPRLSPCYLRSYSFASFTFPADPVLWTTAYAATHTRLYHGMDRYV